MQVKKSHRMLAVLLAVVLVVGMLPATALARSAGDDGTPEMNEAYAGQESLMPVGPSFNVDTLLEWTPESDPDAPYSRASIPLTDRITGFVVNPLVNPEAKLMLCSLANSSHDSASAQGTESFLSYSFNYWQYTNSFVYWSGSEEGIICCPTGEFIDAAHTNGVPVVATLGFPWGSGSGYVDQVKKFVQKADDGSFPVADKLIEVMEYYGFDGYFFNQESYGCSAAEGALIDEMMRYMHQKCPDMLISWYDSMLPTGGVSYQNAVNSNNKQFMTPSEDGTLAIDEFFMNYNWYESQINDTISTMQSIGRSPFDAFAGIDVQQNCMDTSFRDHLLVDADGMTRISLALYCPNSTMGFSTSPENFHEIEQTFYTNSVGDPRDTSVDLSTNNWAGMSRFFADKTAITSAPFVTNFNSGHGKGYYVDGVLSRTAEWSYQSNQDVMPTWTWIIDAEGEKLAGGYDFDDAWNGGNSIRFSGNLAAGKANDILLYSTKVAVEDGMTLSLTYKGGQGKVKLVGYYGDASTTGYDDCEKVAYDLTNDGGAWTTTTVDISASAGKTLYAIGLKVESDTDIAGYQLNLGQLAILDRTRSALNGPADVTLDEILYSDAYTAEARIYWSSVTGASSYEIYQVYADGTKNLIMETPNTAFYIPTLVRPDDETNVTLEIVAINRSGVRGASGTTLTIPWAYTNDDSEKIEIAEFENVCLNATVTGVSFENSGEPASKALDGTAANNSKWCATNMGSGWMSIDIGREVTVRRWRVEHAEYGGEANNMNTIDFSLKYKNADGEWVEIKRIQDNHAAVTDVLLDEPVTAQEWMLYVYDDGSSPWGGIRIYEWQMFETAEFPQTSPVPMRFASAVNNTGAADVFTLTNVPAYTTIKVYTQGAEGDTCIGSGETGEAAGTVELTDLDFGTAEAGRVYYTCTGMAAAESSKMSAAFEAENAEKTAAATDVTFVKYSRSGSTSSSYCEGIYTAMTVSGLTAGDVVYVYGNGADSAYTNVSQAVPEGQTSVTFDGIFVTRSGGTLPLQVKSVGKLPSDIYTVETPAFPEPTADLTLFAYNKKGESLTGVVYGVYNADGEKVTTIGTTSDSGGKAALELGSYTLKCEEVPEGYSLSHDRVRAILRIEGWNRYIVRVTIPDYADPAVTAVTVSPEEVVLLPGQAASFQAEVTGEGNYDEGLIWTVTGATSADTVIDQDGNLTVGADETACYLTVTAASVQTETTIGSATVILTSLTNIAGDAELLGYNGSLMGEENGPEKLVDGNSDTKWQESMGESSYLLAAYDLGSVKDVYEVRLRHAGSAGEDTSLNTSDFYIKSVNESAITTGSWQWYRNNYGYDFVAGYLANYSYYTNQLASYTGSTDDVTTVALEEPTGLRTVIVHVTVPNSAEDDDQLRLYELEVMAINEDQVAGRRVMVLIDAIGEVTKDSEEAVQAARDAYDALTDAQKPYVENYQVLLDAEAVLRTSEDAKEELKAYYDALLEANEYSENGYAQLAKILEQGLADLDACELEEVTAVLMAAEAEMDAVPTYEEELAAVTADAEAFATAAEEAAAEARQLADEAAEDAAEVQTIADEIAETYGEDSEEAVKAAEVAEKAREAAEKAAEAADQAGDAATLAREKADEVAAAAAAADLTAAQAALEGAQSAAEAAAYARDVARSYREIAGIELDLIDALQQAWDAARKAEEERRAAEEARKAAEEAALNAARYAALMELSQVDTTSGNHLRQAAVQAIISQAREDINNAETIEAVEAILADALADIEAAGELKCAAEIFTDVDEDSWFHEDVDLLYNAGYMVGTSATTFGSADNLTREQVVAILYRIAGSPSVEGQSCTFTDVNPDAYYANAVIWGSNNGIVFGYNATTFGVGDEVTREQLVAFLYRYAGSPAVDGDLTEFPDADTVSEYAVPAMTWAVENGIVVGAVKDGKTVINPEGTAIRAQAAAIFARYLRRI